MAEREVIEHVPQPQLCPGCAGDAKAKAEAGPPNEPVTQRCTHNAVLAVASKRGKSIVHWHIHGPGAPGEILWRGEADD